MSRVALAFLSGLVFAAGLGLAGMTQPAKVQAFLDIGGAWDPSLAFVMAGAIVVHAVAWAVAVRRGIPVDAPPPIDARLVGGAAVFGVGWALSGWCPGPSVVAMGAGVGAAWVFGLGMFVGQAAVARLEAVPQNADTLRSEPTTRSARAS